MVLYEIPWIINLCFEISKKDKPLVIALFRKCVWTIINEIVDAGFLISQPPPYSSYLITRPHVRLLAELPAKGGGCSPIVDMGLSKCTF